MKKIYSLIMMMMVCICASATDYYLIGGFNSWTTSDAACKFTANGDGTYTLNYQGTLTSGFKVNDGTWDNPDINFGSNGNPLVVGEPYSYAVGSSTGDITMGGAVKNPTVVLNPSAGTITVSGAAAVTTVTYDIWRCFESADSWAATELTDNNGVWEGDATVTYSSAEFGIRKLENGNQTDWFAATSATEIKGSTTINLGNSNTSNIKIAAGTYHFAFNVSDLTLVVTAEGTTPDPEDPETPEDPTYTVSVNGAFNSWQDVNTTTTIVDNCATIVVENYVGAVEGQGEGFKIVVNGKWYSNGSEVANGAWNDYVGDSKDNMTLPASAEGQTVTFTIAVNNVANGYINFKAKYTEGTDPEDPALSNGGTVWFDNTKSNWEKVYIYYWKGDKNNGWPGEEMTYLSADAANGMLKANYEDATGLYYFTIPAGGIDGMIFNNGADGEALRQTADIEGDAIVAHGVYTADGYTNETTGIDSIEASENGAVEYFNLQGVRVAEPAAGLYIVRRGNKISKQIIR